MRSKTSALGVKNTSKVIIILIIFLISYYHISYNNFKNDILINENKIIEIKSGYTLKDVAKSLDLNQYFFKKYILKNKKELILKKWNFKLLKDSNIDDILISLEKPIAEKEIKLTIIEWWNVYDIDEYLYKKELINKWDYISYTQNPEKIKALTKFYQFLNKNFISLEWYLYPDTYSLKHPLKINELVIKQLDTFETKVYEKILKEKKTSPLARGNKIDNNLLYDVINLAAIVEKEERNNLEKSTVAGILKKRLNSGWMIWADITVCYPHGLTSEECKLVVSKYIREKSEYNTRTKIWLPKTPIANPSYITINATLNDKKTKYWFYLHNVKTWKIHYAETNFGHEANKKYMY
jgi:UPF0755 protein